MKIFLGDIDDNDFYLEHYSDYGDLLIISRYYNAHGLIYGDYIFLEENLDLRFANTEKQKKLRLKYQQALLKANKYLNLL